MNFFKGRIDRKTFMLGMAIVGGLTVVIALALLFPIAVIGLVVPLISSSPILEKIILLIPASFFAIAGFSLFIKRAHDLGSDGAIWFGALVGAVVIRVMADNAIANLLPILVIVLLCALPGNEGSNRYGRQPSKKLRVKAIYDH